MIKLLKLTLHTGFLYIKRHHWLYNELILQCDNIMLRNNFGHGSFISLEFHLLSDGANRKEDDDEEDVADDLGLLKEQGDQPDLPLVPRDRCSKTFWVKERIHVSLVIKRHGIRVAEISQVKKNTLGTYIITIAVTL